MGTLSPEAAAATAAAAAAQMQFALTQVAQPVLIASFVTCSLYGLLLFLIITYFVRFRTDRLVFRLLVGFYLLSATADTAIECGWAYGYTISAFSNPTVYTAIPWPYIGYAVLGPNVLLAQGFYTWRVWIISNKKAWPLASVMLLIQVAACCLAFYLTHWAATADSILSFKDIKVSG
ncbi:uncharacterized protein JCM10292_001765 [Rhodotorula paludigena]|uniref:uncharacterized protein n=1 Tax=Rhodotorula paludigena TaxID=86838 RepID=UPI00317FFA0E